MGFVDASQVLYDAFAEWDASVDQTDENGQALTNQAGSNRVLIIAGANENPAPEPTQRNQTQFPASMTIGGESVLLEVEGNSPATGFYVTGVAAYVALEAKIAAFVNGNWTVVPEASSPTFKLVPVWYDDIDQGVGVVDSGYSTDTDVTPTVTLTTQAGDICIGISYGWATTVTTSDTERMSGTVNGVGEMIVTEKIATGASTVVEVTAGVADRVSLIALALRPGAAAAAGETERAAPRGRSRGRSRGRVARMAANGFEYIDGIWRRPRLVVPVGVQLTGA